MGLNPFLYICYALMLTKFYSIRLLAVEIRDPGKHSLAVQSPATIDAYG